MFATARANVLNKFRTLVLMVGFMVLVYRAQFVNHPQMSC